MGRAKIEIYPVNRLEYAFVLKAVEDIATEYDKHWTCSFLKKTSPKKVKK